MNHQHDEILIFSLVPMNGVSISNVHMNVNSWAISLTQFLDCSGLFLMEVTILLVQIQHLLGYTPGMFLVDQKSTIQV